MAVMGQWNGHNFEVAPGVVRSFSNLQIKTSAKTEDKSVKSLNYDQDVVRRKSSNATEVTLSIILHANMGVDVRSEAMRFAAEAQACVRDYFYVNNAKLYPCKLALVDTTVQNIEIAPNGRWQCAEVQLTMKQYTKLEDAYKTMLGQGASSGGGSGSSNTPNKDSVNKKPPKKKPSKSKPSKSKPTSSKPSSKPDIATTTVPPVAAAMNGQTSKPTSTPGKLKETVSNAVNAVKQIVNNAKNNTKQKQNSNKLKQTRPPGSVTMQNRK